MAEIQQTGQRYPDQGGYPNQGNYPSNPPRGRVAFPSSRYRSYSEFGVLRVSVPDNWRELSEQGSVWFAPEGAYGSANGQTVFTHGMNFGAVQTRSRNLQQASNEFINSLEQGNGNLRARSDYQRTSISGRSALTISLSNTNEATGRSEIITVTTAQLRNGELFYAITVSPDNDFNAYRGTFTNVLHSIQLLD